MAEFTVPPAMVEAGRDVLDEKLTDFGMAGSIEIHARLARRSGQDDLVRAILAAALSVCEVHEEWGYRSLWSSYQQGRPDREDWPHGGRRMAEAFVAEAELIPSVLIHRLVITTPAEEATDG